MCKNLVNLCSKCRVKKAIANLQRMNEKMVIFNSVCKKSGETTKLSLVEYLSDSSSTSTPSDASTITPKQEKKLVEELNSRDGNSTVLFLVNGR